LAKLKSTAAAHVLHLPSHLPVSSCQQFRLLNAHEVVIRHSSLLRALPTTSPSQPPSHHEGLPGSLPPCPPGLGQVLGCTLFCLSHAHSCTSTTRQRAAAARWALRYMATLHSLTPCWVLCATPCPLPAGACARELSGVVFPLPAVKGVAKTETDTFTKNSAHDSRCLPSSQRCSSTVCCLRYPQQPCAAAWPAGLLAYPHTVPLSRAVRALVVGVPGAVQRRWPMPHQLLTLSASR
jgi:hypothetical protein